MGLKGGLTFFLMTDSQIGDDDKNRVVEEKTRFRDVGSETTIGCILLHPLPFHPPPKKKLLSAKTQIVVSWRRRRWWTEPVLRHYSSISRSSPPLIWKCLRCPYWNRKPSLSLEFVVRPLPFFFIGSNHGRGGGLTFRREGIDGMKNFW